MRFSHILNDFCDHKHELQAFTPTMNSFYEPFDDSQ